jgi:Cu/Ag efflux protein CusF
MKVKAAAAVAIAFSLLAGALLAEISLSKRAFVVAVDVKAKSITLKHKAEIGGTEWKESVVYWDDKTTWEKSDRPATTEMAKSLKKDDKVFAVFTDRSGKMWWLESLSTLPASEPLE